MPIPLYRVYCTDRTNQPATLTTPAVERTPATDLFDQIESQLNHKTHRIVLCAGCRHPIASSADRFPINDQHEIAFTNPSGYHYRLCFFSEALGCVLYGRPTTQFSWFPGYYWRFAHCAHCHNHLGWYYLTQGSHHQPPNLRPATSTDDDFFGLISQEIIEYSQEDFQPPLSS